MCEKDSRLARDGFLVVGDVLSSSDCDELCANLPDVGGSGSRLMLELPVFQVLAKSLREHARLSKYIDERIAMQCILFWKTSVHNWGVPLHRDEVLPIRGEGEWRAAGEKEGRASARPSREFMDNCIAVRLHLDGAPQEDVSVVRGSHLHEGKCSRKEAKPVAVPKGGVLLMNPSLLHASSKVEGAVSRRVLHYVFAPKQLPVGYSWYDAC